MYKNIVFVLVLLFAVLGWSACRNYGYGQGSFNTNVWQETGYGCENTSSDRAWCENNFIGTKAPSSGASTSYGYCVRTSMYTSFCSSNSIFCRFNGYCCDLESERDSIICLYSGNQWLDGSCCDEQCLCFRDGGQWVNGSCQNCNDHVDMPDKCMEVWKNGYTTDSQGNPGGGGYWAIETYTCFYDSCAMSLNCTPKSSFPAGSLTCDDFQDTTSNNNCVAVIGHQCTIQCPNNVTINCDCDGSCNVAATRPSCQCPQMSSSSNNSSSSQNSSSSESENSSSSSASPNSSNDGPNSSNSPVDSTNNGDWEYNYSGVLNDIEWNTRQTATNTNIAAGYLSSIDKWQSIINMQNQVNANEIKSSVDNVAGAVAQATSAVDKNTDTLHHSNELIESVRSRMDSLFFDNTGDMQSKVDSINALVWSYRDTVSKYDSSITAAMKRRDTSSIYMDSIKIDSSQYRTKYKDLYLSDAVTREGCYILRIRGNSLMKTVEVDFSNIGGFDLCGIIRGFLRVCTLILITIIEINFFKRAFASGDN